MTRLPPNAFDIVKTVGLALPHVEATTRDNGAPVLKIAGVFMAGLATHSSAEPNTLVVRADLEDRDAFIEDAPDVYYLTDYYRPYPLVLVRLERVTSDALRELLSSSHRLTLPKTRLRSRRSLSSRAAVNREYHSARLHPSQAALMGWATTFECLCRSRARRYGRFTLHQQRWRR